MPNHSHNVFISYRKYTLQNDLLVQDFLLPQLFQNILWGQGFAHSVIYTLLLEDLKKHANWRALSTVTLFQPVEKIKKWRKAGRSFCDEILREQVYIVILLNRVWRALFFISLFSLIPETLYASMFIDQPYFVLKLSVCSENLKKNKEKLSTL